MMVYQTGPSHGGQGSARREERKASNLLGKKSGEKPLKNHAFIGNSSAIIGKMRA